ncbi:MAG: hypothetical protein JWM58_1425 [Rhizobium sp.]|nr:hypothetical protein [Rhizobium sp.]
MKKIAFAFAATIAVSTFAVSTADAMSLGSLSRMPAVSKSDEIVTNSIPGTPTMPRMIQPKFQLIFFTVGSFMRQSAQFALAEGRQAGVHLISLTAAE